MDKKYKQEMREEAEFKEEIYEESDNSLREDRENATLRSSELMSPEPQFLYKQMRINPDSSADFPSLVDKDVVLANVKGDKPDIEFQREMLGCIQAVRYVFTKKIMVAVYDKDGKRAFKLNNEGVRVPAYREELVFDEMFLPVDRILQAEYKHDYVASRGIGDDREAKLDITTTLLKRIQKSKEEGKPVGFGRGE